MVGLMVEQHFLPLFPHVLEESKKFLAARKEFNIAAELNKNPKFYRNPTTQQVSTSSGKRFGGGSRFKGLRQEDATVAEIQELLENAKILSMHWESENHFTVCLGDGKMVNVGIRNLYTGDCVYGVDRSYPLNDTVADVAFNDRLIMYLLSDGRLHVIWKETPSLESDFIEPDFTSLTHSVLPNKTSKRCEKKLTLEKSNMFAVWWSTSKDDVLPWLPNPEQRANIFIYNFEKKEPVLLWFLKTSNKILGLHLSAERNKIIMLEESTDFEGNILVTEIIYCLTLRCKESETIIPVSELTSHAYDCSSSKLALTCCDSSVLIYSQHNKIPRTTKAAFIPFTVSWHPDSHLIFVGGGSGQYQFFDIALNPVLLLENNTLSVTHELAICSSIQKSVWMSARSKSGDSCLLLRFQSGPMIFLRLAIQRLDLYGLVNFYVREGWISEAINILKNVPWMFETSLQAMYTIFAHLIRQSPCDEVECRLEQLLAVYFVPTPTATGDDNSARKTDLNAMRTLARRFFMWLLQENKCQRAIQVATSLKDMGLFYKLHQVAIQNGDEDTAILAMQKISENQESFSSETDSDSESSGSWSSSDSGSSSFQSSEVETIPQDQERIRNSQEQVRNQNLSEIVVTGARTVDNGLTIRSDPKISIVNFGQV